jgi:pimeloyl-ACP methyl ester carboxylesterase
MVSVETALGRVPISGSFDSDRPLVLAIRGAFASVDQLSDLDPPDHDLALLHLPGFHSPRLTETSMEAFVAAFDEVIRQRFAGRQITVVGISTGAVVALGLRAPEVRGVLAVEPFFSTAKLWPLIEFLRRELQANPQPALHEWVDAIFGVSMSGVVDRNYQAVLARRDRPVLGLVGDVPLNPVRPVWGLPSLTDEADRALLPNKLVQGGHNVPTDAIRSALRNLHQPDEDPATCARDGRVSAATRAAARR